MSKKKNTAKLWGLWNYDVLKDVSYRRKDCRVAANNMVMGGDATKLFRQGAFRITKITVREI